MKVDKILGYIGLFIVIIVIIYLLLKVVGIIRSISIEEILLGFAGGQALLDVHLLRALGRVEGRVGISSGRKAPEILE